MATKPSILNMAVNKRFPGSTYYEKIEIDFENLSDTFIDTYIIRNFEDRTFHNFTDQSEWRDKWRFGVLTEVLKKEQSKLVQKAIEYAEKSMQHFISQRRDIDLHKQILEIWRLRIEYAKELLEELQPSTLVDNHANQLQEVGERNPEFTTARQVLAIHYLLEHCGASGYDKTNVARFIQFLTGKETGAKNIGDTQIYKRLNRLFSTDNRTLAADLTFVRGHFEKIGLPDIAQKITKEINTK